MTERDGGRGWVVLPVMLPMLFAAQLLAADPPAPAPSSALRELIDRAAAHNRAVPVQLDGYRAQVESEISVLTRKADGTEVTVSLEQTGAEVAWQRPGDFAQHVTGYRARLAGPSLSALAVMKRAWAIPLLYGDRLSLFFGQDSSLRENGAPPARRTTLAVHPFSSLREQVYQFSGGDTVAVLQTGDRAVTVVQLHVEPRLDQVEWPVVVFRGEIDLDAEWGDVVRMRGQFLTLGRHGQQSKRVLMVPVSVMAYVDLESVLVGGRYWLPRRQRIEQHLDIRGLAEGRSVFRVVSRFRDHRVTEGLAGEVALSGDSPDRPVSEPTLHRLTVAPSDSLSRPRPWALPLGEASTGLHGDDFTDVAPVATPRVAWRAQRLADLVHFNRVEGWSTGAAMEASPAGPLRFRANAAWAWTERTVRGRIEAIHVDSQWTTGLRLGRTLDITNDFTAPHDSGGSLLAAVFGVDDYDYVARRSATLWLNRTLVPRKAMLRVEGGIAEDRPATARLTEGLLPAEEPFLPNRGVDAGRYVRTAVLADWNPVVNADALASGVGMQARHEVAAGSLAWQRTTLRVIARAERGPMTWAVRADAGALFGADVPSQQLFEVGGEPMFPGFAYKTFAGDRAFVGHARAAYRLPVLRAPLRVLGCTCLTAPAPALAATVHGARLGASSPATMTSIARLGSLGDRIGAAPATPGDTTAISSPTNGWRGSLEVGLRFFGGAATVAAVRPMESGAPWRASVVLGQSW